MRIELLPPITPASSESEVPASTITIRVLTPDEIITLSPVFAARGVKLPDPQTSFILGAFDNGNLTANFQVVQLRIHADPLHLEPGYEHLFRRFVSSVESTIAERLPEAADVYVFAPPGKVSQMAQRVGMVAEPWTVFSRKVYPKAPVDDPAPVVPVAAPVSRGPVLVPEEKPRPELPALVPDEILDLQTDREFARDAERILAASGV